MWGWLMQTLLCRSVNVAVAGTPVVAEPSYRAVTQCWVSCPPGNTKAIYFGGEDMSTSNRFELAIGERILLTGIDLSKLKVDVQVNNENVDLCFYV